MKFINKLEQKFGRYAIPNLMLYVIIINAVGFLISQLQPQLLLYICWDMEAILHGQIWRLVTFMMFPFDSNMLSFLLYALVYYSIGNTLERTWGAFRFNLYIFTGILGHILAGVLLYAIFRINLYTMSTSYLNMSLFLALAMTYPDSQFLLFFVIPVKAKWMAAFSAAFLVVEAVQGGIVTRVMIVMSLLNFLLYLVVNRNSFRYNPKDVLRRNEFKRRMNQGPGKVSGKPLHKCTVCGRTDKDHPELEFRYCSKCAGAYEYCNEHLYTHIHIKTPDQAKQ